MKTIKELENKPPNRHTGYTAKDAGYYKALKDVLKLIDELNKEADDLVMGMSRPEFSSRFKQKIQGV